MIFIDGVGIGENDVDKNPFFNYSFTPFLDFFGEIPHNGKQELSANGFHLFPVDACMGVEGLPQSGTGQTSIFCGVNAPRIIGKHFGPYPYSTLIPIIQKKNIFREFLRCGMDVAFANAYPKVFFDYINSGRKRLSVTSLSCLLTGVKLKNVTDLRRGKALSAEIDNYRWVDKLDYNLPIIKPQTAANRLLRLSSENHFTLFEYFLTDHIGHGRIPDSFDHVMLTLERFLLHILRNIDDDTTLVICSDHGNLEDITVKGHTLNPALTITGGKYADELRHKIKHLYDIKPAILAMYD